MNNKNTDQILNDIWDKMSLLIDSNPNIANDIINREHAPYHICIKLQKALGEEIHEVRA